jgi:hypothetical protein
LSSSAGPLGRRLQGGHGQAAELVVDAGDRGHQGRLDHLVEPGHAHAGVPEDPLEVRVQRGQVEQGLIDVEDLYTAHLGLPGHSSVTGFTVVALRE